MNHRLAKLRLTGLSLACASTGLTSAFDLEAWKTQYGTALTPSQFYSTRPGPWGDYFSSTSTDCANATFLYLGPLGVKARPYDQALSTAAFSALYPPVLTDTSGLIQNSFGVMDVPAGAPADGHLYPGDVILEIEDQWIKTANDISFPFPIQAKSSRGLEIHAGQLVDAAEGRGAVKLKLLRAAETIWNGGTVSAPSTSSEVTVSVTGTDFVRLITSSPNNALTNWINPRLENGSGGTLYLNAQTINQKSGYASPIMGKDATNATVFDGAASITNCIGTRSNSMIEYAIPAGYTTLKFKVQTTGSGSIQPKVGLRKSSLATSPPVPRQFDVNGAPVLPPEVAAYVETVEFAIPQIGSFGSTYDPNSEKVANYAAILAERLAREQNADGSWPSGGGDYADGSFRTSLAGLGLLSTGNPAFNTHLQKAANYCANVTPSGWAYPRGTRLMFLAEYYLRTKDAAILPGLQKAVNEAEWMITSDFTCGHGLNMGYGGAGYIGATGTIGTGLAIASKCPVIVDAWKLDNLLERVQELAGGNGGALPYSRGGIGRNSFPDTPSAGQSYSCGAGGVLATKIRGGPQYITELFRKKFGAATTYGDADGGHASEALTFIMGSLACQIWGDEAHQANMNRFLWRLTLKRDYSGYINLNTNRLEFHGGDGGVHGGPTYDTGGYLVLLNSHKHNLAITGKPEHQATVFPNTPPTYDVDRKLYWRVLNDWNMVDAALGSQMPASLQPKLEELRNMPLGADLATRVLAFLQREALSAATLVNGVSGVSSPEKQHYCEMLLGVGHDITAVSIDNPVPTSGLSNYRFSLNGYTATTTWDSWGGPTLATDPAASTQMSGTVTLTDPSGLYLASPRVLNFSHGSLNPTTDFQVPVTGEITFTATFNYTVGGSLPISYTRNITINPAVPFNVDSRAGNYTNVRKVWIPGNCPVPFEKWNMPVQLPSGITLPGASKNEGTIGFHTYDNGVLVSADDVYKSKIRGKPAGYWAVSSDRWGECAILGVNLLSGPVITTTAVSAINPTSASSGGNVTSDGGWPVTQRGVCWSTSPYPTIFHDKTVDGTATGSFTSGITNLEPGTVYHVRAYATNAVGTSYGENLSFSTSGSNGIWITNGGGSWPVTANWQGGVDASGADGIADFSTVTPAADATVTLDGPRSIGGMIFGNAGFSNSWILGSGTNGSLSLDIGVSGDPTITVNGGAAVVNVPLLGVDGLVKAGPGSLTLAGANTYTGLTSVNAGTLVVTGSLSAGSPAVIGASGILSGTGTLGSHLTVNGNVAPGAGGIGTLTTNGRITLAGTAAMEIHKTGATCDKLAGSSAITYGGTLSVTNLAGTLAAGDKFILFPSSAYSGAFATLNLPALGGGLKWDTSGLLVDGSILVGYDAAITGQPSNQSVGQGVNATFTVTATGLPAPTYQWQISTNGGTSWSNVSGATSASVQTGATVSGDSGKQFRCVVSNGLASVTSNAATLTVTSNSLPVFTVHPVSVFHSAAGQTVAFSATATGTPAPGYQWQVSTNAGGSWANIAGAVSSSYSFTSVSGDNNKAYRCIATNTQGSATSNVAQFLIATDPTWIQPLGGSWPVNTNWTSNTPASGAGATADFSRLILPAPATVTLDGARTIGNMKFGDAASLQNWILSTGTAGPLTLAVSSGSPTITVNNQTTTISAVLAGTNGLTKAGSGNLVLTGSNTYSGGTILSAGTLTLNQAGAIAGGSLTITGGTLANASGSSFTLPGNQAWNGNFTFAGPNSMTVSGAVTLNANRTLTVSGGDLTVSGAISGAYSLTKAGANTLTLSTGNSYSGGTIVSGGKLVATAGGWYGARAIGTGALTVNAGATAQFTNSHGFGVDPGGRSATINNGTLQFDSENYVSGLSMTGGAVTGGGEIRFNSNLTVPIAASSSGSTIAVGLNLVSGTTTFNVSNGSAPVDLLLSGGIYNVGSIIKTGSGLMRITGAGSNSGTTTISTGTVQLAGGSLGTGTVTLASGATLSGNGSMGGAALLNGALATGVDGAIGTISASGNMTLSSTTVTTMKLGKAGNVLSNDQLASGGTLTCAGSLTVTASGDALATGDTFQLLSAPTITGTFSSVTLPALSGGLVWDTSRLYIDGSISLGKVAQTITFDPLPSLSIGDVLWLDASASSGLVVSYSSSNPAVAILQFGDYLTAVGTGTTTITASQPGNAFYQAAPDVSRTLTVNAALPAVSTVSVVPVTPSTATSGGANVWDGGSVVTERGVCWSTSPNPTVANSKTLDGSGTGSFTSTITGLVGNTTYHVRAYARNSEGYGYGGNTTFIAPVDGVWAVNAGGSWPVTTNWTGGQSPNGLGSTANFATLNITGNRTVTLDTPVTVSAMVFGDTTASHNWTLNTGTGGSLALDAVTGTPNIAVNNQSATINVPIAGAEGLSKSGAGTLVLGATNTFTGGLTANAGITQLKPADYSNALASNSIVTINNGATVQVGAINCVGNSTSFVVNAGGTLTFQPYHCHVWGLTLNGGSITTSGSGKYASEDFALDVNATVGGTSPSSITITNGIGIGGGSRTITVADATGSPAADLTLSGAGALRNGGTFVKAGPGTMAITNANVHSGGTTVSEGTLLANNASGSATGSGPANVSAGATLGGTGFITGATSIAGTLAPGANGIGTLTINNTLTLSGVTLMEIQKTGATLARDRVQGVTTLTYGGALTVTSSGDALAAGDSFALFGATTYAGNFTSISLPALGSGLAWDSSQLAVSGTISVISNGAPQTITFNPLPAKTFGDAAFNLTASASSGLQVSYASSNPSVATISGSTVTLVGVGSTTITASQAGNGTYAPAIDVSQNLDVVAAIPVVTTTAASNVASSTASAGGTVTSDGGDAITARGVCWSVSADPTTADSKTIDGTGTGTFTSALASLSPGTIYHFRAYATNSAGTAYGPDLTFTTLLADNFTWANASGGSWPASSNWLLQSIGDGAAKNVRFDTLDLTSDATVTLDGARTIGNLTFADTTASHHWTLNTGSAGPLTLQSTGAPVVTVNNQSATFGVILAGSGGLTKNGSGTLILNASNIYTGNTVIDAGVLEMTTSARLYNAAYNNTNTLTVNSGGTWRMPDFSYAAMGQLADYRERRVINGGVIEVTGATHSSGQNFTVSATGGTFRYTNSGGTLSLTGNTNGNIRVDGALTFDGAGNITTTETIEGAGSLTKSGSGTLILNQTGSTFSGNVTVNGGILQTGGGQGGGTNGHLGLVSGSRSITVNSGSTLHFTGNNVFGGSGKTAATVPPITVSGGTLSSTRFNILGNVNLSGASLITSATDSGSYEGYQFLGTLTVSGTSPSTIGSTNGKANHLLNGTTTFDVSDVTGSAAADLVVSNPLRNSSGDYGLTSGSLAKTGAGTMQLSAANSYTGTTTVSAGTLTVTGSLAASTTTVASGATLGGSGSLAGAVSISGTVAPGFAGIGTLTINNTLTLAPGAVVEWELGDWNGAAGTGFDRLVANSATITALQANPVTIRLKGTPANFSESGKSFTLLQSTGGITGFNANLFSLDTSGLTAGAGTWSITQSGNNLLLVYTRSNTAPSFPVNPITLGATQGTALTGQLSATDPDLGETLAFSKSSGPAWLDVSPSGVLSGTPANGDVGNASFTVQVTDSFNSTASATLQISVANLNEAPTFVSGTLSGTAAAEDSNYAGSVSTEASDPDLIHGDTLVFSKVAGPAWLNVAANGTLSGVPTNSDVGANTFTLRVTDAAGLFAETQLGIEVTNTNDAPVFAADPIHLNATEDTAITGQLAASDVDAGDTLVFAKVSGPAWLAVSTSGELNGTPSNSEVGLNTFTVSVSDGGITTNAVLHITVANTNDAPVFAASTISGAGATGGEAYSGSLAGTATDVDAGDTLTYSKTSGPAWLTVATDGTLGGTPSNSDAGSNAFTIRATDGGGLHAETTLLIEVVANNPDANTNGMLDAWEIAKFGNADPGAHPPDADPDGDGLNNLLEYALDTHPLQANASPLVHDLVADSGERYLHLTVPKNPLATNLAYTVETCGALNDWSSAGTVVESDTSGQLVVRDGSAVSSTTRRFIRLKVATLP